MSAALILRDLQEIIESEECLGHELSGTRPAVVLSESFGMFMVVPFTTSEKGTGFPHTDMVEPDSKNGLSGLSSEMCFLDFIS
jgi:mRNA-degrading endonuclease toxin of MazEF toxin-antitoxin module